MGKKMRFILNVQRNKVKFLCYRRLYSSSLAAKNYKLLRFSIPLFYTLHYSSAWWRSPLFLTSYQSKIKPQ